METNISKWNIFEDFLSFLFFPFLAFDIFIFCDDGMSDFELIGKLWLVTFLLYFIFYLYKSRHAPPKTILRKIWEIVFSSFLIMFFIVNFFLAGIFLIVAYAGNKFLI